MARCSGGAARRSPIVVLAAVQWLRCVVAVRRAVGPLGGSLGAWGGGGLADAWGAGGGPHGARGLSPLAVRGGFSEVEGGHPIHDVTVHHSDFHHEADFPHDDHDFFHHDEDHHDMSSACLRGPEASQFHNDMQSFFKDHIHDAVDHFNDAVSLICDIEHIQHPQHGVCAMATAGVANLQGAMDAHAEATGYAKAAANLAKGKFDAKEMLGSMTTALDHVADMHPDLKIVDDVMNLHGMANALGDMALKMHQELDGKQGLALAAAAGGLAASTVGGGGVADARVAMQLSKGAETMGRMTSLIHRLPSDFCNAMSHNAADLHQMMDHLTPFIHHR